jgi:hypothetical protein
VVDYLEPVVTGWWKQEILKRTWSQVDLHARTARLNAEATKERCRPAGLSVLDGELLETIQAQSEKRKVVTLPGQSPTLLCLYVFHRNGKPIKAANKHCNDGRKI